MPPAPGKKIFLVDDDEFVRESLCALLEAYEFKVEAFASGREFLAARDGRAAAVIVDLETYAGAKAMVGGSQRESGTT